MSNVYRRRQAQKAACLASLTKVFVAFIDMRVIMKFHPSYRPRTRADDALLDKYTNAIAQMVQEKSLTDVWHSHALAGQSDRYHITPDAGDVTYIVWLHDGLCIVEHILPPFTSCSLSLTEHTQQSEPL